MKEVQENKKKKEKKEHKKPKRLCKGILSRSRIMNRKNIWTEYCQEKVLETINKPWFFLSLGNQNFWNDLKILLQNYMAATSVHVHSTYLTKNFFFFWLVVLAWKQLGQWEIVSWIYQSKIVPTTTFKR